MGWRLTRCLLLLPGLLGLTAPAAWAQDGPLPLSVGLALRQAQVPESALGLWVQALDEEQPRLQWQARRPMNPASVAKLITSAAALDTWGPTGGWSTPVWLQGRLLDSGVLEGDLLIKGNGDPSLNTERLTQLLRRLQQLGLREIRGNIVLDGSAFAPSGQSPADFDNEPWRPANVQADALPLNLKTLAYSFRPDVARQLAWVSVEPSLDGAPPQVLPLQAGPCGDWRAALKLQWQEAQRPRFAGAYPAACGEQTWTLAYPEPARYAARLLAGAWRQLGGRLQGSVIEGPAPAGPPGLSWNSPPLAELLREMNKSSNNLMAQQLLLSLARPADGTLASMPVNAPAAADWLMQWLRARVGDEPPLRLVNGSGLARETQISAEQLAHLLRLAWAAPWMPEFIASLPLAGLDGTLARQPARFGAAQGRAHLKTGSLRDVAALAGYVQSASGRRYLLVAVINHPLAPAARPALDALVRWVAQDAPAPRVTAARERP